MATRSHLSILSESLLLTTLLLCLSFSSSNATSRNMARTVQLEGADLPSGNAASTHSGSANSCAERESSQTRSNVEQDLDTMPHPAKLTNSLSFLDSAGAVAKVSDARMSNHDDDSEWVRDSEHKNVMDIDHLREDEMSMKDSKWMRDAADRHLSDLEKVRDPRIDRMSESERINDSDDTMSDIDKRIRNPERLRDSHLTREESERAMWSTEKMRDFDSDRSTKDSDRSRVRGSDEMRDSDGSTMDAGKMQDPERMVNSDGIRDSDKMIDSGTMRDSHRVIDSDGMRDLHKEIDWDGMRDMHRMTESDSMRNSDMMPGSNRMMDSDGLRDSQNMGTSHKLYARDYERSRQSSEEMLNSERMSRRDSERLRDSNQVIQDQDRLGESAENLRNSEWRSANLRNSRGEQSDMMRDSYRMRTPQGRRDLENTREANNMMDSAAAQRQTSNLDGEKGLGSEMMGDAKQTNGLHRIGDLERRRDLERMRNSDNMQSSEKTSANSHRMRNSKAARSTMEHMEREHSSTAMEPSSCQGTDCPSTSDLHRTDSRAMEHETMAHSSRRSDAEMAGSRSENSEASIDSSTTAELIRCSGMNAADCDAALAGQLQGSRNMHIFQREDSSDSCRLEGADCHMTTSEREAENNPRSKEMMRSTTQGRMSSCSNENCHKNITNNEEPMAGRQHRTRNDREIVASPKWVKLERRSSTIKEATRMDNSQKTSPLANQGMTRPADAEIMQASRNRHFNSIDAERKNSNMRGSDMQRLTSNHWTRSTMEITDPSSCTNEADCRSTSGSMHMSPGNSDLMGHKDEQNNGRSSCTNEADCRSTSGSMHISPKDSELMGHKDEQINGQSYCIDGVDCRSTSGSMHMSPRDSELMGRKDEQINGRSFCTNEADCRTSGSMHISPRDSELMGHKDEHINGRSSCSNGVDCRSISRSMHMNPGNSDLMGHSDEQINGRSSCTNEADCRSSSGNMHMSPRDSELMGHKDEQINGRSSCVNGAECRSTSGIVHMSPRESELMGHKDEQINGRSSCTNEADCRSYSGSMHMSTRDSEMLGHKDESGTTHTGMNWSAENGDLTMDQEMEDDSKMMVERESDQIKASAEMMHNLNEAAADNLPIHRGN